MATVIRRLLALFIFGKSSAEGLVFSRIAQNRQIAWEDHKFDPEKAENAAIILSQETREVVSEVCSIEGSDRRDAETFKEYSKKIKEDCDLLAKMIFSRNLESEEAFGVGIEPCDYVPKGNNGFSKESPPRCPSSVFAGFLTSICGIYMGSLGSGVSSMSQLWLSFVTELRDRWEGGTPLPHMELGCDQVNEEIHSAAVMTSVPLWRRPLWNDAVQRKKLEGWTLYLPATLKDVSPLTERLQFIQFCIAFKEEATYVSCPHDKCSLLVSSPCSIDADDEKAGPSREESVPRSTRIVGDPHLQRRLPITRDSMAESVHLSKKFADVSSGESGCNDVNNSSNSSSSNSSSSSGYHTLLRWQVLIPSLVSDMKSFKAENPWADVTTFRDWYCEGLPLDLDDKELQQLWSECEGRFAQDQKPLFRAEKEVEKAFAQYPDYHSFRFIQGTHLKQKWVAKVAFQNQESIKNLLAAQNHVAIGQKLCKIAEFQPKGSSSATSEIQSAYSTTKSSYGEDEPARAIGRLDKFKFPNHQFFSPFSSPDLYDDHPNYPQTNSQSYSSQDLAYKTYLHKSDPHDFPKKLPTHLSLSSPTGDHGLKPMASMKAQPPVQILLSDLDNDDDGNLFQLFTGDGKHKKSS
jgi:hypothetical protein